MKPNIRKAKWFRGLGRKRKLVKTGLFEVPKEFKPSDGTRFHDNQGTFTCIGCDEQEDNLVFQYSK